MDFRIRSITPHDAEAFLGCLCQLDKESDFMLLEAGERTVDVTQQRRRIQELMRSKHEAVMVAESDAQIVGFLGVTGGRYRRDAGTARLVVGVLQSHTRHGIGSALMRSVERWALDAGVYRLELTVMSHNTAAIRMYERLGYEKEGIRRESLIVNGDLVSEYYMSKLLQLGERMER